MSHEASLEPVERLQRGPLALDEAEALQLSKAVADEWDVMKPVRPCVATLFVEGVGPGTGGRVNYARLILMEASVQHNMTDEDAKKILNTFNYKLLPSLPIYEIRHLEKGLGKASNRPYGCRHALLRPYCIGSSVCPTVINKLRWGRHRISMDGFMISGWWASLTPKKKAVWGSLYHLARLKGLGPADIIPFTYAELERVSHVDRHYFTWILFCLYEYGLIVDVNFNFVRGGHTSCRFPKELPTCLPSFEDACDNFDPKKTGKSKGYKQPAK